MLGGRPRYKTDQSRAVLAKAGVRGLSALLAWPPSTFPLYRPMEAV